MAATADGQAFPGSRRASAPAIAPTSSEHVPNPQQGLAVTRDAKACTSPLTVASHAAAAPAAALPDATLLTGAAAAPAAPDSAPALAASRPAAPARVSRSDVRDPRKLFVGGLPPTVDQLELRDCFKKFGEVIDSVVVVDSVSKRSRGFGFITFAHERDAAALLVVIPGKTGFVAINGKRCEVKASTPRHESHAATIAARHHAMRSSLRPDPHRAKPPCADLRGYRRATWQGAEGRGQADAWAQGFAACANMWRQDVAARMPPPAAAYPHSPPGPFYPAFPVAASASAFLSQYPPAYANAAAGGYAHGHVDPNNYAGLEYDASAEGPGSAPLSPGAPRLVASPLQGGYYHDIYSPPYHPQSPVAPWTGRHYFDGDIAGGAPALSGTEEGPSFYSNTMGNSPVTTAERTE